MLTNAAQIKWLAASRREDSSGPDYQESKPIVLARFEFG